MWPSTGTHHHRLLLFDNDFGRLHRFLVHRKKILYSQFIAHGCLGYECGVGVFCRVACECYIGYLFIINSIYYYSLFAFFRFILECVAYRCLVSTSPFHRLHSFVHAVFVCKMILNRAPNTLTHTHSTTKTNNRQSFSCDRSPWIGGTPFFAFVYEKKEKMVKIRFFSFFFLLIFVQLETLIYIIINPYVRQISSVHGRKTHQTAKWVNNFWAENNCAKSRRWLCMWRARGLRFKVVIGANEPMSCSLENAVASIHNFCTSLLECAARIEWKWKKMRPTRIDRTLR